MYRTLPWLLLALFSVAQAADGTANRQFSPSPVHLETALVSAQLLSRFHYQPVPLDDAMSEKIFERYLKSLDPDRLFLLQSDVTEFEPARTRLDDAILRQDLAIPFALFTRYSQRQQQRLSEARALLEQGFDFARDERYRFVRTDAPWPANDDEARELWRQRVKNDWLRLKLNGMDDKAIRDTLGKRYDNALARAARIKSDDVFQVFMNAYANAIEPHTAYLGPRAAEDFAISMKLSLVGIGAVLQERDDFIIIRELVPGGPAARSAQLGIGDRIVGVAQGEDGTLTDVMGWRVDDVVALIRGTKGSTVVLDILPADAGVDGEHKRVAMVRDTIKLENQAASKTIIDTGNNETRQRVGVITLPTFYQDTDARRNNSDFRSATRDVARLLDELKRDSVDAVLVDLRNNGGGSLDEAISLTGLFIDTGPVVQQRNPQGQIRVERDTDPGVAWDGPVGVLINRASASASEIFAAAIQDYGRGVVIGEPSFGKGTVQTLLNLDDMAKSNSPRYGELKMTIAQFFRISGGTTQLHGVSPDIEFPATSDFERFGESSYDNALPWTRINAASFRPLGKPAELLPALKERHQARTAASVEFRHLQEDAAELAALRKRTEISLNEAQRRKERDEQSARQRLRQQMLAATADEAASGDSPTAVRDDGLLRDERSLKEELAAEAERKTRRDILKEEAAHVVADFTQLQRNASTRTATDAGGTVQPPRGAERASTGRS